MLFALKKTPANINKAAGGMESANRGPYTIKTAGGVINISRNPNAVISQKLRRNDRVAMLRAESASICCATLGKMTDENAVEMGVNAADQATATAYRPRSREETSTVMSNWSKRALANSGTA